MNCIKYICINGTCTKVSACPPDDPAHCLIYTCDATGHCHQISSCPPNADPCYRNVCDAEGCNGVCTAVFKGPVVSATSNSPVCSGSNVNLSASVTGGAGTISYSWTGPNAFTSNAQRPVISAATTAASGTYTVTATDDHNCTSSATVSVVVQVCSQKMDGSTNPLEISDTKLGNLEIFPNPATGEINIRLSGYSGNMHLQVINILGQQFIDKPIELKGDNLYILDISPLLRGIYEVILRNDSGYSTGIFVKE